MILAAGLGVRIALRPASEGDLITPDQAHAMALSDRAVLVDIRRPDEWARSGIGEGAIPLDMRRPDFIQALSEIVGGARNRLIILICAGGVRSRWMASRLAEAGFSHIIDVPEGMQGSRAGPGWLRRGLPTVKWDGNQ